MQTAAAAADEFILYTTVNTEVKIGALFTFHGQNGGADLTQSYQCLCLHGDSKHSDG